MNKDLENLRLRFIEASGNLTQSVGAGRTIGQIFAHIYLSREAQSLDHLTEALGISKGGASMAVRQLEQWGGLRKVWIKGERRDYYEAQDDLGRIVRRALLDTMGSRMSSTESLMQEVEDCFKSAKKQNGTKDPDWKFVERKLRNVKIFRDRAYWIWNHSILKLLVRGK